MCLPQVRSDIRLDFLPRYPGGDLGMMPLLVLGGDRKGGAQDTFFSGPMMAAGGVAAAAGRSGASEPGQVRDARATAPFLEL